MHSSRPENTKDSRPSRPDWVPENAGTEFATHVMKGASRSQAESCAKPGGAHVRRARLGVEDHVRGVLERDPMILGRTITLIESNAPRHQAMAQEVLRGAQTVPVAAARPEPGVTPAR